jgi:predicted O-methyltransferase YrrM
MSIIEEIYSSGCIEDKTGARVEVHSNISRQKGAFLIDLIKDMARPSKVVEIGCAFGLSSLHIGEALRGAQGAEHIIIDPNQTSTFHGLGIHQLERAGLGNYRLIEEPSGAALPALAAERPGAFGLVFIDGLHTFDQTLVDLYYADRLLAEGGVVVVDDASAYASVAKAVSYFARYPSYRIVRRLAPYTTAQRLGGLVARLLPPGIAREIVPHGLYDRYYVRCVFPSMLALQKTGPDTRDWDWFEPF